MYSAGYVGSAISGALQLVLAFRFRLHRGVLYAMGVWVTAMGVIYAGNAFTLAYCLVMGAVLLVLARVLPAGAVRGLVTVLAVFTGLYALFDLRDDLWSSGGGGPSDAVLLAAQTRVPRSSGRFSGRPGRWRCSLSLARCRCGVVPSRRRWRRGRSRGRIRYATKRPNP